MESKDPIDKIVKHIVLECVNHMTNFGLKNILDTREGIKIGINVIDTYGKLLIYDTAKELFGNDVPDIPAFKKLETTILEQSKTEFVKSLELGLSRLTHGLYDHIKLGFETVDYYKNDIYDGLISLENKIGLRIVTPIIDLSGDILDWLTIKTKELENKLLPADKKQQHLVTELKKIVNEKKVPKAKLQSITKKIQTNMQETTYKKASEISFQQAVQYSNDTFDIIKNIGILTCNNDIIKASIIGHSTVETSQLINGLLGVGMYATMGPLGLAKGFLNVAVTVSSLFENKRDAKHEAIMSMLQNLVEMINSLRQEIKEGFEKVFKQLNQLEQNIIVHFLEINLKQDLTLSKLDILSDDLKSLKDYQVKSTALLMENMDTILSHINYREISDDKTRLLLELRRFKTNGKDKFDDDFSKLAALSDLLIESLSGYNDVCVNREHILSRFNKLPYEFNINSLLNIFNKELLDNKNIYVMSDNKLCELFKELVKNNKDYEFNNLLDYQHVIFGAYNTIVNKLDAKYQYHFIPIYGYSYWNLLVINTKTNNIEYYGSTRDYDFTKRITKLDIKTNWIMHEIPKEVTPAESAIWIYMIAEMKTENKTNVDIKNYCSKLCDNKLQFQKVHNPLVLTLITSTMIDLIECQKTQKGNYLNGFLSDEQFKACINLLDSLRNIRSFMTICTNKELYTGLFTTHISKFTKLYNEISKYRDTFYEQIKKQLDIDRDVVCLEKYYDKTFLLDLFKNQKINVRSDYYLHDSWFAFRCHHYAGRDAGINNYSASYYNDQRGGSYTNSQRQIFEKRYQDIIAKTKESIITQLNTKYYNRHKDKFELPTTDYVNYSVKYTHKYFPFFMTPLSGNFEKEPILPVPKSFKRLVVDLVWDAQELGLGYIEINYRIINKKFEIVGFFKLTAHIIPIFSLTLPCDELIHEGNENIWWQWFGGELPIKTSHEILHYDSGINSYGNGWANYVRVPDTKTVDGWYDAFNGDKMPDSYEKLAAKEKYQKEMKTWVMDRLGIHVKNKIKEINVKLVDGIRQDIGLTKLFDDVEMSYNIIKEFSKLINKFEYFKENIVSDIFILDRTTFNKHMTVYDGDSNIENYLISTYSLENMRNNFDKYLKDFDMRTTWLDFCQTEERYVLLLCNIQQYVTYKYSAIEKLNYNKSVTDVLMKVIEIGQKDPDIFSKYNVYQILNTAKTDMDADIMKGNVEGSYKKYVAKTMLALTYNNNEDRLAIINQLED